MSKRETIEEFLARGGTITKCEPGPKPDEELTNRVMPTPNAAATILTLGQGALYYSESRAKPKERKSTKKTETINLSALPSHLLKYVPSRN